MIAGALLLGSLRNALQLVNVPSDVLNIVTGVLLIVAVVAPQAAAAVRGRRRPRRRPAPPRAHHPWAQFGAHSRPHTPARPGAGALQRGNR